jgi:pimeloyl-[acyl-carrier protein] methyl ester esterase
MAMLSLVILPGLDGTAELLADFMHAAAPLFDSVSAIRYPVDQPLGYSELEALVRQSLPKSGDFILLGESFSGPIALSIAASSPPGLRGLVLSTTFAKNPISLLRPLAGFARFAPVRAMPLRILSWWLLGRWATPRLEVLLRDALRSVAADVLRRRAMAAMRADVTECLERISVPVIYLRATGDRLLAAAVGEHILRGIPHTQLARIVGPHLLLQTAPTAVANEIAAFAARLRENAR